MILKEIPPILEKTSSLQVLYPQAIDFANKQLSIFWLPEEIKVEKDIQDILINMTPAEKHGVITTLKLFTLYELKAGSEYWGGRFKDKFTRTEFQRMASVFAMFELAIHKPFYSKINELLHLDTDEFYFSYEDDPILKDRMSFIDKMIDSDDDLESLAGFSMIEGAILYSAFAYLKHFQSQGKNKLLNIVRGINFSVRDENLHADAGAWAFRTLKKELNLSEQEELKLKEKVFACAKKLYEHECHVIDLTCEKGSPDGITVIQLKHFAMSRLNHCLSSLGYEILEEVPYNPIGTWFYEAINGFTFNDTFSGVGNSYHRNWTETDFVWETYKQKEEI